MQLKLNFGFAQNIFAQFPQLVHQRIYCDHIMFFPHSCVKQVILYFDLFDLQYFNYGDCDSFAVGIDEEAAPA